MRGNRPLVPITGQRKSVKIFGCIEVYSGRFIYQRDDVFNANTYLSFLDKIAKSYYPRHVQYVQDNASYHKKQEVWDWFRDNRRWFEVYNLPPYSPEYNAAEPIWHHTRVNATHNKTFHDDTEIMDSLTSIFRSIQRKPNQILGYLHPFQ
jgi:transposase